jgi:hypothetical protein
MLAKVVGGPGLLRMVASADGLGGMQKSRYKKA